MLTLLRNTQLRHLGLDEELERDYVSKFERGILEPTLNVLLAYARAISTTGRGEFLEAIIDDEMDLPEKMPADPKKALAGKKRRAG